MASPATSSLTSSVRASKAPAALGVSREAATPKAAGRTSPACRRRTKRPTGASGWVLEASIWSTRIARLAQCPAIRASVED